MEETGILVKKSNTWEVITKFPPKKKGSDQLKIMHNFIPVNINTIKPVYPMYYMKKVLESIINPKFFCYFVANSFNKY